MFRSRITVSAEKNRGSPDSGMGIALLSRVGAVRTGWIGEAGVASKTVGRLGKAFTTRSCFMTKLLSTTGWTSIVAFALSTAAMAGEQDFSLLNGSNWESFVSGGQTVSLAWSGEDETMLIAEDMLGQARQIAESDEGVNIEIVTALPAPEPPALVLAGMAFGGVLCGRSFLSRRRRQG